MTLLQHSRILVLAMGLLFCDFSLAQIMLFDANDEKLRSLDNKTNEVVGIFNVFDAVQRAAELMNRRTLIIVGHGGPGVIGMGSGDNGGYTNGEDLDYAHLADVAQDLTALSATYAPAPAANPGPESLLLLLVGCESGQDEEGQTLVRELSNQFENTYVVASTVPTSAGFHDGSICARQVSAVNPADWSARFSVLAFRGALITDRATQTAIMQLVNARNCVECDDARQCPTPRPSQVLVPTDGGCSSVKSMIVRPKNKPH